MTSFKHASVSGVELNEASNFSSSVIGGFLNEANGVQFSVCGGATNLASCSLAFSD